MTRMELEQEMLSNPVRNLQYMLWRLSTRYPFLPQLAMDGLFGEETLEAVMLFSGSWPRRSPVWWISGPGMPSTLPGWT